MTTEVKQQSFEELYTASLKTVREPLFNIKREMELLSMGDVFICYACTGIFKLDKRFTIRHRDFCPDCYRIVKTEPRTKEDDAPSNSKER